MGGDFIEVLHASEKVGGRPINHQRAGLLWNCLDTCKIVDLGFKGSKFT